MLQRPDSIAQNALERYTSSPVQDFGNYILLANFRHYVHSFSEKFRGETASGTWAAAHSSAEDMTIIDYGIGSPMAGLVMDVLSYTDPKAVIMLGLCGGLDAYLDVGGYVVPTASIRDEGTSVHYLPPTVPALPSLNVNAAICQVLEEKQVAYRSGIMKTTDY
ncbi:MAG: hypothetical protein CO095_01165 [Armatimonadetes bacterium CG_4_9_14_3_um_filter_58_7]|nr:MAG: hypothetical protein CO095_01165 [Armatimonadetes bacterium CG_4_9_14_3_um_filter_58_7]